MPCDRQDSWDRVERKHEIRKRNAGKRERQHCRDASPVFYSGEAVLVERDGLTLLQPTLPRCFLRLFVILRQHQPDRRDQQRHCKDVRQPFESAEQSNARNDKRRPHGDRAQDAPKKHAPLFRLGDAEALEKQEKDEQVINRERLLQRVSRHELLR